MTVRDGIRTTEKHGRGHSSVAQRAIADARRCDEHNARQRVAVTRVRALLVELGRATQIGAREPFAPRFAPGVSAHVVEPAEILGRNLAPR